MATGHVPHARAPHVHLPRPRGPHVRVPHPLRRHRDASQAIESAFWALVLEAGGVFVLLLLIGAYTAGGVLPLTLLLAALTALFLLRAWLRSRDAPPRPDRRRRRDFERRGF